MWQNHKADCYIIVYPKFWADCYVLIMHTDYWELIDFMGGVMVASSSSFMMNDYRIFHGHDHMPACHLWHNGNLQSVCEILSEISMISCCSLFSSGSSSVYCWFLCAICRREKKLCHVLGFFLLEMGEMQNISQFWSGIIGMQYPWNTWNKP
jgi:hypothetical protein